MADKPTVFGMIVNAGNNVQRERMEALRVKRERQAEHDKAFQKCPALMEFALEFVVGLEGNAESVAQTLDTGSHVAVLTVDSKQHANAVIGDTTFSNFVRLCSGSTDPSADFRPFHSKQYPSIFVGTGEHVDVTLGHYDPIKVAGHIIVGDRSESVQFTLNFGQRWDRFWKR